MGKMRSLCIRHYKMLIGILFASILTLTYWQYKNYLSRIQLLLCLHPEQNSAHELALPPAQYGSQKNALLLAYPRSGSSFTGELISAADNVFYLYEPSYEYVTSRNITNVQVTNEILTRIFTCRSECLDMLDSRHFGDENFNYYYRNDRPFFYDVGILCRSANIHLIKTIRLTMAAAKELLEARPSLNLKIVHLVRDPRAMVNSMNRLSWKTDGNKAANCSALRDDLNVAQSFTRKNYLRIRYEDIAKNALDTIGIVYKFLGMELDRKVIDYITSHTQVDANNEDTFATYRGKDFDPNHWKSSLGLEKVRKIEKSCRDVMMQLGYDFLAN